MKKSICGDGGLTTQLKVGDGVGEIFLCRK